jgi:hypothetical protein
LQEFQTRLWYAPKEDIEAEPNPIGVAPLVTQRISDIEVSRRRLRIFLANQAIALGWALKGSCKPCAHRLFTTARWLVPEAQRFLVHRTGSHNRNRRIVEFAIVLGTLLRGIQPRLVGGFLIVLAFVGSLDLATRTTAIDTQPLVENSAFLEEPQIPSESKIVNVSKSSEPMQGLVSETASLSGAQIAPVPLPLRKPEGVNKVPNGAGAKANPATQKRMAQQKRALPKPMR